MLENHPVAVYYQLQKLYLNQNTLGKEVNDIFPTFKEAKMSTPQDPIAHQTQATTL